MSSKFGLGDDTDDQVERLDNKVDLSSFSPVKKRSPIDLLEVDAAAAPHGFVSREAQAPPPIVQIGAPERRRRVVEAQPTRQLAIRMMQSQYDRFVGYADRHKLTYQEAIMKLLDVVAE